MLLKTINLLVFLDQVDNKEISFKDLEQTVISNA